MCSTAMNANAINSHTFENCFAYITSKSEEELADFAIECMQKTQNNGLPYFTSAEYYTAPDSNELIQSSRNQCCYDSYELGTNDRTDRLTNAITSRVKYAQEYVKPLGMDESGTIDSHTFENCFDYITSKSEEELADFAIECMQKTQNDGLPGLPYFSSAEYYTAPDSNELIQISRNQCCYESNELRAIIPNEKIDDSIEQFNANPNKIQTETSQANRRDNKKLQCRLCKKYFMREYYLKMHLLTVHKSGEAFGCPHCKRIFGCKQRLQRHIQILHDERRYKCSVCKKCFAQQSLLRKHIKVIHNGSSIKL